VLRHRRLVVVVVAVLLAALLAASGEIHRQIVSLLALAEPVFAAHPVWGAVIFTGLSALGAILVFVSSWLLVPIGVQAWGPVWCFVLLWAGWFLGGLVTYSVGRHFGRPMVRRLLPEPIITRYEGRIPAGGRFLPALLVTVSVPSDIAGYFFGLVRYPAGVYLSALAVGEIPYGLGAVLLTDAFLQRRLSLLLILAGTAGLAGFWAWRRRQRRLGGAGTETSGEGGG
jgi:uncharacterized membrane protein YdjX (TVP38/TMEM64 family)